MGSKQQFTEALLSNTNAIGLSLGPDQAARMWQHYGLLAEANRRTNLTRITDPAEAAVLHYADSLAVVAWVKHVGLEPGQILDVGTGGGFPAIPSAICRPDWQVTAIDGTAKKIECVRSFVEELGLANVKVLHQRAEHWRELDTKFDLLLLRAVAPLADCLRKMKHLRREGATVVCYKSDPVPREELSLADRTARSLGMTRGEAWRYHLSAAGEVLSRQLCIYQPASAL